MQTSDQLVKLSQVPAIVEKITGDRPHVATIHRWHMRGCKKVKLQTAFCGGHRRTSERWAREFFDAVTAAANGTTAPQQIGETTQANGFITVFEEIKRAAAGRWAEILPALTPLTGNELRKGSADHPCPLCGGKSTIWLAQDAQQSGSLACRTCPNSKPTGDGIATVAAFAGLTQGEAAKAIADYLGLSVAQAVGAKPQPVDIIAEVCRAVPWRSYSIGARP